MSLSLGEVDVLKGVCDRARNSGRSGGGGGGRSCRGLLALALTLLALALALALLLAGVFLASGSSGLGGALALVVGLTLLELLIVLDLIVDILNLIVHVFLIDITSADGRFGSGGLALNQC